MTARHAIDDDEASDGLADKLEGVEAIAAFLGPEWTERRVYRAREVGSLPIRRKPGIGLYAFRSELCAALKAPETLGGLTRKSA